MDLETLFAILSILAIVCALIGAAGIGLAVWAVIEGSRRLRRVQREGF